MACDALGSGLERGIRPMRADFVAAARKKRTFVAPKAGNPGRAAAGELPHNVQYPLDCGGLPGGFCGNRPFGEGKRHLARILLSPNEKARSGLCRENDYSDGKVPSGLGPQPEVRKFGSR